MRFFKIYFNLFIVSSFILILGCKKNNESPTWHSELLLPLIKTEITFDQLIADSLINYNNNQQVMLAYNYQYNLNNLDTLYDFLDTAFSNFFLSPFPAIIGPNFPLPPINNVVRLSTNEVELKFATIKSGKLVIVARNTLAIPITYNYNIPGAKLLGVPFSTSISLPPASGNAVAITDTFDLTNYEIDLRGNTGLEFNKLAYSISGNTAANAATITVNTNDTLVNIQSNFLDVVPRYVKGYLGTANFNNNAPDEPLYTFASIGSGFLDLEEANLNVRFENYIGADISIKLNNITGYNSRTNTAQPLVSSTVINGTYNINRAIETFNPSQPALPGIVNISLNKNNSNLQQFTSNLPDQINYAYSGKFNALGNISGSTDFIYSDYLLNANLNLEIPLKFSANQLQLLDTVNFNLNDSNLIDKIVNGSFKILTQNLFPIDFLLSATILDSNDQPLISIVENQIIAAAPIDNSGMANQYQNSTIEIPFMQTTSQSLKNGKKIAFKFSCSTAPNNTKLWMYKKYNIKLSLIADLKVAI